MDNTADIDYFKNPPFDTKFGETAFKEKLPSILESHEENINRLGTQYTFDTIADAQAYTGFVAGDRIQVLGYYSKSDGGGHERVYSLTDDGSGVACGVGFLNYISKGGIYNVKHFGAKINAINDDTEFVNKATLSSFENTGNTDYKFRRNIYIPAGEILINGEIFLRKGQTLSGAGANATRIKCTNGSGVGVTIIKCGISSLGVLDGGGLPVQIKDLAFEGGDVGIDTTRVAGCILSDLFITSIGTSLVVGTDTVCVNIIIDMGLVGLVLKGINNVFSNMIFYNMNYGIQVQSDTYDCQFNNCHFEYVKYSDIYFADGQTNIKNIKFSDCQFLLNEQFSTKSGFVYFRSNGASVDFDNCSFRNSKGASIVRGNGTGNYIKLSNCIFDGLKTVDGYNQSTTSKAIEGNYLTVQANNCIFRNLKSGING